jgi:hypothetical protein
LVVSSVGNSFSLGVNNLHYCGDLVDQDISWGLKGWTAIIFGLQAIQSPAMQVHRQPAPAQGALYQLADYS